MKRKLYAALGLLAVIATPVFASGLWPGLPIVGGSSFCSSTSTGVSGQVCTTTVPAGPSTFTGAELFPADTKLSQGQAPQTVAVKATALGVGALLDVTTVATATVPANTPFYMLDGAQGSAFTITMPAAPQEGDIQHIVCTSATVGTLTVAANTGQTLKNNPNAACTAGVGYAWRYVASSKVWYRYQ